MVVEHGDLQGIVALKDMLRFLSLKLDLEHGQIAGPDNMGNLE
jgi:hypothetical protein